MTEQETKPGFVITPAAAREIARQKARRGIPEGVIRVGLRGGGCSGFSYFFDWEDEGPQEGDHVFEQHGATVYIDRKSYTLLEGTTLDFTSSLMGHGFKFENPRAKKKEHNSRQEVWISPGICADHDSSSTPCYQKL